MGKDKVKGKNKDNTAVLFNRYLWLLNTVSNYGPISLKEIQDKWENSVCFNPDRKALPRETFIHHRKALQTMFYINIECDSSYRYYIDDTYDGPDGVSKEMRRWMLNSLSMSQLAIQSESIENRILFEKTNPNPQYLLLITEAMSEYSVIELTYRPYEKDAKTRKVKPLCLKNFRQRWYVVVQVVEDERIIIYALDERVKEIRKTGEPFKMPKGFNAEEYFKNSFGIMVMSGISPTLVKIRVTGEKAKYLRSLPLHHTQEEESNDGKGIIFSYYLTPAYDFKMELLRHGKDLEVIYPDSLRNEIADIIKETVKLYQ